MANSTFNLSVVAPDRTVVDEAVASLIAPSVEGYIGIWAGRSPMILALKAGVVEVTMPNGTNEHIAVGGGFMEVSPDSVIILADDAQFAKEIDIKEAEEALDRAKKALRGEESSMTTEQATQEIEKAMNRIKAARN